MLFGEAGLAWGGEGLRFKVPEASKLRWLFVHDLDLGKKGSVFVGRAGGRAFVASSFGKESLDVSRWADGTMPTSAHFPEALRVEGTGGLQGILFWDVGASLICLGNTEPVPFSGLVPLPAKSKSFATSLFAEVEELQPETGLWVKMDRLKLVSRLEIKVDLKPNSWRALKVSTAR